MAKVYIDNEGSDLILDCGTVVTGATSITIEVLKPDMTTASWAATVYGTNYIKHTIVTDDFDQAGLYKLQASFTLGAWIGRGDTAELIIHRLFG